MVIKYKIYEILKEAARYSTYKEIREHPVKKFTISPQMKNAQMYNSENNDLFKYIYTQGLEKVTKKIGPKDYSVTYNIMISNNALDNIKELEIESNNVLEYTEMAIPYISKSLISDANFNHSRENLFYFEGESYGFGFILSIKNQNIKATTGSTPDPVIDIIITRVTTPENEDGIIYVHNSGSHKELKF